ncbi:transporter substrate-binding domain-containing protein [Vibrio sp. CAIM 722]|uniref:Transporter substrate-binding domain-containing protein n=1 Tax=Vibrio eleionomae TaxID=2653505 RepID=A0A7X4LQL2_9VIBR|nr:ABC transporter substrate-binding protein [Vibrio eleionomae]MZI96087.1 transporter substrate-binding domain-containing protein [Vibrio eleionomae]
MKGIKRITITIASVLTVSGIAITVHAADTLRIGTDLTYPPYNYLVKHKASGFDAEFMRMVAEQLNEEPKFMDTRFANLIMGINLNKFDVIASTLYVTPARAKQISYIPYMKTGGVILAPLSSTYEPKDVTDLCGKRVSSIQGAAWIQKLNQVSANQCVKQGLEKIDVREFPTSPEASQAVIAGMVDAQIEDAAVAKEAADKSGKLHITSPIVYPVVVGLGLKKGNSKLETKLKDAVAAVEKTDKFKALLKQYSVSVPDAQEIDSALKGTL